MVVRSFVALVLLLVAPTLFAQGGPPMQNDDPETVEMGHWETNLAMIGAKTDVERDTEWLRVDANYGFSKSTQLKFETPVTTHRENGETHSGLGSSTAGVRWRFLDQEQAGVDVSTYPQLTFDILRSSSRHGVTSGDDGFFLPFEVARDFGALKLGAELGRNWVESAPDELVWGVIAGTDCLEEIECMVETRTHHVEGANVTVLNAGTRVELAEDKLNLLASFGRGVGPDSPERPDWVFYLGVQVLAGSSGK